MRTDDPGVFDQTSAAAFRLSPDFRKLARRMLLPSRVPRPAPGIWPRQPDMSERSASRIAADTAFSPTVITACMRAT
jgi:hypothetical protein